MKKENHFPKALALIIAVIGIFLILLNSVKEPVVEESIEIPSEIHALGEELVEEEIIQEIEEEPVEEEPIIEEEIEEKPIVKTIISDAKCENGIISLRLNNLYDDVINVKWSTFFVSGMITANPGCDKELLTPGDSTFCSSVSRYPMKGSRRVAIAIYKHTTVGVTVDCSDNLVTGSAVKEQDYSGLNIGFMVVMVFLLLFIFNYYRVHY